jgi:hypothetical protein
MQTIDMCFFALFFDNLMALSKNILKGGAF